MAGPDHHLSEGKQVEEAPEGRSGKQRPVSHRGSKWRWAFAIVVTGLVHAGAFFFITVPDMPPADEDVLAPRVAWLGKQAASTESAVGEQLFLFDQAPLYFPTQWNYTTDENVLFGGGTSPADSFGYYQRRMVVGSSGGPGDLRPPIQGFENAGEAVETFSWPYFSAFGRIDREVVEVSRRLGAIEVRKEIGGDPLIEANVDAPAGNSWPDWQPFDMLVLVGDVGMVGEPLVVPRGAGSEVVEDFFRDYVRTQLRLDLRIPPGYYLVSVGP